jgi:hypothetical protein
VQLTRETGRVCFASTIVSASFAGLRVRREISITASPIVQVRYWLQNEGDRSHTCKLWFFDLISAETTIPAQGRVELSPLHLYCGPGDWRTVRRI